MCECLDPVKHEACRSFGQFYGFRGAEDLYKCMSCGIVFAVPCKLMDLSPTYWSMRDSLRTALEGGGISVEKA